MLHIYIYDISSLSVKEDLRRNTKKAMSVFVIVSKKRESKRTGVTQTPWYHSRVKIKQHSQNLEAYIPRSRCDRRVEFVVLKTNFILSTCESTSI